MELQEAQIEDNSIESFNSDTTTFFRWSQTLLQDLTLLIVDIEYYISQGRQTFKKDDEKTYNSFIRTFRALTIITNKRIADTTLPGDIRKFLKNAKYYDEKSSEYAALIKDSSLTAERRNERIFEEQKKQMEEGIDYAEDYIEELYNVGILDVNVKEIFPFPYDSLIDSYGDEEISREG